MDCVRAAMYARADGPHHQQVRCGSGNYIMGYIRCTQGLERDSPEARGSVESHAHWQQLDAVECVEPSARACSYVMLKS
jgi:hypothetical protein